MARKTEKAKPKMVHSNAPPAALTGGRMERLMDEVHTLLSEREFESIDEMNAFLREQLKDGTLKASSTLNQPTRTDPRRQAQELCWDAGEAPSDAAARRLYKQALDLDPDCADALVFESREARTAEQAITLLERAVRTAAERLGGAAFFNKNKGHFWMIQETRPYMRARAALAEVCSLDGRMLDCVSHYEEMLDLCPNDNQGVRYFLIGCYLRMGEMHRAGQLLARYQNDGSSVFLYANVLMLVMSNSHEKAKRVLKKARAANGYVYEFLAGLTKNPPRVSAVYTAGDESEAAFCVECLLDAFMHNPDAIVWMHDQAKGGGKRGPSLVV
ncbi:MAG: hypothetical protein IT163_08950 [Bryobacterales bacterium]|nr:hypothetical protein [Bryobacterales bacterium]